MRGGALIPAGKLGLTLLLLQSLAVQAAEIKVIATTGGPAWSPNLGVNSKPRPATRFKRTLR